MRDRTTMRADMRIDLKDSGSLWSDAELNRCIDRAVADFSRFLPRELLYEEILSFTVSDEAFTAPIDTDIDRVVDNESLTGKSAGDTCTIDGQPDVPRFLTATITDASSSITGLVITISGFDKNGLAVTEALVYALGQSKTLTGKQYFNYVSEVKLSQIGGTTVGDVLEIGVGAYTDVWVYLANKPIKSQSETVLDAASATCARNTDYRIDYINGRVKAISGGKISASEACTISYKKQSYGVDLSVLSGLIRVHQVEYPVGSVPQVFCQNEVFGNLLTITGLGESDEQSELSEGKQIRIYYDAVHQPPADYAPGTIPEFLESTVEMAADAYALFVYALKAEHQALTDLDTARTAIAAANTAQTAIGTALTALKKYLDNNSTVDAVGALASANTAQTAVGTALTNVKKYADNNSGLDAAAVLAAITTDVAGLRAAMLIALQAANDYMDAVNAASTGDLTRADAARANYMGVTANYVDAATAPGIKKYLDDGDALLNTIATGGENERTPEMYANFAQVARSALVSAHEQDRTFYQQNATIRINAAIGYTQECAQRLSDLRSYIDEANGYIGVAGLFAREAELREAQLNSYQQQSVSFQNISTLFAREAEDRIAQIEEYLRTAVQAIQSAGADLTMADRFKAEATERRDEVWSIWRDRKEYIGDFAASSMRQMK